MPSLITERQGHSEAISQHEKNLMTRCSLLLLDTNDSLGFEWVVTAELSLHGQRWPFFSGTTAICSAVSTFFYLILLQKYKRNHFVLISDFLDENALSVWKWVAVNVFFLYIIHFSCSHWYLWVSVLFKFKTAPTATVKWLQCTSALELGAVWRIELCFNGGDGNWREMLFFQSDSVAVKFRACIFNQTGSPLIDFGLLSLHNKHSL